MILKLFRNTTEVSDLRELDGLILSGGAARIGLSGELGNCAEFLKLDIPILGICAGHQFMARFYGGDARESIEAEFGAMEIQLNDGGGKIFAGTPKFKLYGNLTMMKCMWFHLVSSLQHILLHVKYKVWRMMKEQALDSNFILRLMIQSIGKEMFENFIKVCAETYKN